MHSIESEEKFVRIGGRNGYRFEARVRLLARERSKGLCEWAGGCCCANNGAVDHITGIHLGRLLGISAEDLRSLDNAQLLCDKHADIKNTQEQLFVRMIEKKLRGLQTERAYVSWDEMLVSKNKV